MFRDNNGHDGGFSAKLAGRGGPKGSVWHLLNGMFRSLFAWGKGACFVYIRNGAGEGRI